MSDAFEPGDQLDSPAGSYRLVRVLGRGGMGIVCEVTDKSLNKRVIMKIARRERAMGQRARDRFNEEARACAQIEHDNVVKVIGLGVLNDPNRTPFYLMSKIEGASLRAALNHHPNGFRIDVALQVALQVLAGLDEMHRRGILHRDIKPDNILLSRGKKGGTLAILIDFGIMLLKEDWANPPEHAYTPSYAAQEQLYRQALGPKADLFALGLVLFEIITGRHPFKDYGKGEGAALARAEIEAPRLSDFGPNFPPALSNLVARLLAPDAAKRPPSALDVIRELEKIQNTILELDLHEAVTDRALRELLAETSPGNHSRTVTKADLANPTDPDADLPEFMRELRARHERERILGFSSRLNVTEPMAPSMSAHGPKPAISPRFRTVPLASAVPGRPPFRSAEDVAEITDPSKKNLTPPKPSSSVVYVDSSPFADLGELRKRLAAGAPEVHSNPHVERKVSPVRPRRRGVDKMDQVIVFLLVLIAVLAVGFALILPRVRAMQAPLPVPSSEGP